MTYAEEEELFPTLPADVASENENMDNTEADKNATDSTETATATHNGKRKLPEKDAEKKVTHSLTFIFLQVKGCFWLLSVCCLDSGLIFFLLIIRYKKIVN